MKQLLIILLVSVSFSVFGQSNKKGFTTADSILLENKMRELEIVLNQADDIMLQVDSISIFIEKELPTLELILKRLEKIQLEKTLSTGISLDSLKVIDSLYLYVQKREIDFLSAKKLAEKLLNDYVLCQKKANTLKQQIDKLLKKKPKSVNYSASHTIAILHKGSLFIFYTSPILFSKHVVPYRHLS